MAYKIIVGRNEDDRKKFGDAGIIFLGKHYVKMGQTVSLSAPVYLDVNTSHVILVSGKRGSGKSFSISSIAEEMVRLPEDVANNLSVLMFDTMGIFWTMKYPNMQQEKLLEQWNMKPEGMGITIYVPEGHFDDYKDKGIPVDKPFSLKISELTAADWCSVFNLDAQSDKGILIQRALTDLQGAYGFSEMLDHVKRDAKAERNIKDAVESLLAAAESWGLFSRVGVPAEHLLSRGTVTVLDLSPYTETSGNWSIKALVIGLISRKLLHQRMASRKEEEVSAIDTEGKFFSEENKQEQPLVWLLIDELHEFLSKEGKTPATDALVQILREGRQPGISLIGATQQPGEIHKDVLTQTDIVISHRLTNKIDLAALNAMMQSYHYSNIKTLMQDLPRLRGAALILDDNSERIYPVQIKPKRSWHGGSSPNALKLKKELML